MERFQRVEIGLNEITSQNEVKDVIYIESHSNNEWANLIGLSEKEALWLSRKLEEYANKLK